MKYQPFSLLGIASLQGIIGLATSEQSSLLPNTSADCCQLLRDETDIENIHLPGDEEYDGRVKSYWSLTAQLTPSCFVRPKNANEVSIVLKNIINKTKCKFAVRSGGHSSTAGANNIEDGITIDLTLLNGTKYNEDTELVSIFPGTKWLNVYRTLDPLGRGVPGGRLGDVGAGRYLLGGGFSLYIYRNGIACDSIRGMEIVLANGTIVEASAQKNPDLFKVMKGSGGAFGIVTRFDMKTFDAIPIWSSSRMYPESAGKPFYGALKRWTGGIEQYQYGSAIIFWSYRFGLKETMIISGLSDISGQMNAPAFDELKSIPGNISFTEKFTNMSESALGVQAPGYRNIWWSLTLKNDEKIIAKAVELHHILVEEMKVESSDGDFETQCFFQPFPTMLSAKGSNILGLDQLKDNGIVLLASLAVNGIDQEKLGREKMFKWKSDLEEFGGEDGILKYQYMNYADGSQDVLASYGEDSACLMWRIAKRFDPDMVFTHRRPGGFKLSPLSCDLAL